MHALWQITGMHPQMKPLHTLQIDNKKYARTREKKECCLASMCATVQRGGHTSSKIPLPPSTAWENIEDIHLSQNYSVEIRNVQHYLLSPARRKICGSTKARSDGVSVFGQTYYWTEKQRWPMQNAGKTCKNSAVYKMMATQRLAFEPLT